MTGHQSDHRLQQRSGLWGLRWNQRKSRVAGIAAQVEQGTAGPFGQEVAQHATKNRSQCVLVLVTRKLVGPHSYQPGDHRGYQGQVDQKTCTRDDKLSYAKRRRQVRKWRWRKWLERRRARRETRAEQKQVSDEVIREKTSKSHAQLGETPKVFIQRKQSTLDAVVVGQPAPGTGVHEHVLLVIKAVVNGTSVPALIDSGASRSFVSDWLHCSQPL